MFAHAARTVLLTVIRWLMRVVYRVEAAGLSQVPATGAAVLVANHVTFVDALFLGTLGRRRVRFVMDHRYYDHWALGWICRLFGAIPIAPRSEDPARLAAAFDAIDAALAQGELVAIFPEGRLTRDGTVGAFRPGLTRILARRPVPVVPIGLRGLWGSVFSRAPRRQGARLRRRVEIVCGPTVAAAEVHLDRLRSQVLGLLGEG